MFSDARCSPSPPIGNKRIRKDFVDRAPGEALGHALFRQDAEASYSGNSGGDDSALAVWLLLSKWFLHTGNDPLAGGQIIVACDLGRTRG